MIMSRLGYLIDVDGFEVNSKFLVKELAVGCFDNNLITVFCFKVGKFSKLSAAQRSSVSWVTRHIHGLKFSDLPSDLPQSDVSVEIEALCVSAERRGVLIGYKGGHYELDILKSLGYAHLGFNIEQLGCPKLEVLFQKYPNALDYQCENHMPITKTIKNLTIAHCPRMELYCFMRFVSEQN